MSQAFPSFSCSKLTTHCTPGGCITVISFDEWGLGICLKNDAAAGTTEQMFLIVDNEACYSLPTQWLFVGSDDFSRLVLLELKGLEEVKE
jgi:hypothetical protein